MKLERKAISLCASSAFYFLALLCDGQVGLAGAYQLRSQSVSILALVSAVCFSARYSWWCLIMDKTKTIWPNSLEIWLKLADNLDHNGRDLIERCDSTAVPLNSYHRGYVSCHVHVKLGRPEWQFGSHYFCAEFRSGELQGVGLINPANINNLACESFEQNLHRKRMGSLHPRGGYCKSYRQPVLIDYGEVSKHTEGMKVISQRHVLVESVVTLKALYDCYVFHSDFFEPAAFGTVEGLDGIANRELDTRFVSDFPASIQQRELKRQAIKRASEINNCVTIDNGTTFEKANEIRHVIDKDYMLLSLSLELNPASWTIRFDRERIGDVLLEGISVFFSPLYLRDTGG